MTVELHEHPGVAVVRVSSGVTPALRETLFDAVDQHRHVVVDLGAVSTLDDVGLGLLVRAHQRARRRDGIVCFAGPSRFVITVLHTMHVDGLFPIFDDCDAACAWLTE